MLRRAKLDWNTHHTLLLYGNTMMRVLRPTAFCLMVEKENPLDLACSFLTLSSSRSQMLAYSLTQ